MNTTLHVTIDKQTKAEAAKRAEQMGLDLSTIVRASINTFLETGVFHVERSYRMTPYLERVIERAMRDYKAGRNISGPFETAGEMEQHFRKLMKKKK